MTDAAAIKATWSSYKHLPTRNCLQLVLEVPLEQQADVFKRLGYPVPGTETWVGVALLRSSTDKPAAPAQQRESPAERTPEERMIVRAIMLCKDFRFQEWICGTNYVPNEDNATDLLRKRLGVVSRAKIKDSIAAQRKFISLETEFRQAHGMMAEVRS